jgi:AcrR family transcriptional regulator
MAREEVRNRILDIAEKLFASKGFDATGIIEIAAKADLTKSLIYYYFKNKDDILTGIFDRFMERTAELKNQVAASSLQNARTKNTKKLIDNLIGHTLPLLEASRDVLKIGLVEEMKRPTEGPLFAYFKRNVAASMKYYEEAGMTLQGRTDFQAYVFFQAFFPLIGYTLLGEEWCAHMGTNRDSLRELLVRWLAEDFCRHIDELEGRVEN